MVSLLEEQLRTLAEHLPFDVWVRDKGDRCLYANATAREHWPALYGKTIDENEVSAEVAELWRTNNRRALDGEIVRGEVAYRHGDETQIVMNLIAPVSSEGVVVGTVGVNIDITSQRRAEAEARDRGRILASVLDTTRAAVGVREVEKDDLLHVLDNHVTAALFGLTPEATVGKTDRELGASNSDVRRTVQRATTELSQRGALEFEHTFDTAAGQRTFVGTMARIEREPGLPIRFFFVADDVTEQRRIEAQLLRGERLASLGTLAASIAHEIKNPASAVLLSLGHLRSVLDAHASEVPKALRDELDDVVLDALSGLDHVRRLVGDLSVLAKPTDVELHDVDVDEVVRSTLALTRSALTVYGSVTSSLGEPPPVRGNAIRLAQVLLNLLTNAGQAIGRTGRAGVIRVTTSRVGDRVRIDVEDDGVGLTPDIRPRLFQAFATSSESGTGLGLHLSRQIVEGFGGTLTALDREGGGAIFRVELPAMVGSPLPVRGDAPRAPPSVDSIG